MMNVKLQTMYLGLFIVTIFYSCGGDIKPERRKEIENEINNISTPTTPENSNLTGRWQLDSMIQSASDLTSASGGGTLVQSDLSKNTKLKGNLVISYYQTKYLRAGDNVQIDEFTTSGKHITTTIDKFSIKKSGKHVSETNYSLNQNILSESWKWGANDQNENHSTSKILKVDLHNLVYELDNGLSPVTFYFSKISNQ